MKKLFAAALSLALTFIGVLAQEHSTGTAPGDSAKWVNIAPENSGFSLLMPGKPSEKVEPVQGSPGVENHIFMFETSEAGYVFSYVQFTQLIMEPSAVKTMLDAGREGALSSPGSKLMSEKETRLNEHHGRVWIVELAGGFVATTHAYWVKRRLYQLVFVVAPNPNDTPETLRVRQESASRYFNSFQLVN